MELICEVRDADEGGYLARALGYPIFTEGETWEELRRNAQARESGGLQISLAKAQLGYQKVRQKGTMFDCDMRDGKLRPKLVYMGSARYVYWQQGDDWLGYFEEYPDYMTQGKTLDDLRQHLTDLHRDLTSGEIPGIRRVADLPVPA